MNTLNNLTGFLPISLYVSYMALMVWCLSLVMGTVGFLSSFIFTYKVRVVLCECVTERDGSWCVSALGSVPAPFAAHLL